MPQEILNIFYAALSTVVLALVSWGTAVLIDWLKTKIKNVKIAQHASNIVLIVSNAVQCVFQTFVQTLKDNGKFDEKAQIEAKDKAFYIIKEQLTPELKSYIEENFGDIEIYISEQIESVIYQLKNK